MRRKYSQQNGETFEKPSGRVHKYFDRSALCHSQATTRLPEVWGSARILRGGEGIFAFTNFSAIVRQH